MSYKILLADDSVTVQKIITLTFSDEGVDVVTVNNGDEAINRLQYLRPELVMADVSIPGKNGYDICEFVKAHPEMKETPVILLIPAFEPFDEERARRIGADYHLTKPFQSIRTLISTVKSLIERKAAPEFSIAGSGLTAIRSADRGNSEAIEVDPKRARIEELIKLSAQTASENAAENAAEDEILSELDLTRSESGQPDSLAVTEMRDEVEIIEPARDSVIEAYSTQTANGPVVMELYNSPEAMAEDLDNVLELDDISPEAISASPAPAAAVARAVSGEPRSVKPYEKDEVVSVPQSVIDEIVRRVVAQLSEKLSSEIARRIAPEVAELIRHQQLARPAARRDAENLLDID